MSRSARHAKHRVPARWWKDDPLARGNGLGLVLHLKRRQWTVASVLRGSPGERARVRVGDVVRRLDGYDLQDGDSLEFLRLLRSGTKRSRRVLLHRKGEGAVVLPLAPKAMALVLGTHRRLGGSFGTVGLCRTCNLCLPTIAGFAQCGQDLSDPQTGRKCSGECMLA
jgi:hypothetical protein